VSLTEKKTKFIQVILFNQLVDLCICFSRSSDLDTGIGSLHIAVRRVLSVGSGTGFPGDHTSVRLLESNGTQREEDYAGEEHVPGTDRGLGTDRGYLHESP